MTMVEPSLLKYHTVKREKYIAQNDILKRKPSHNGVLAYSVKHSFYQDKNISKNFYFESIKEEEGDIKEKNNKLDFYRTITNKFKKKTFVNVPKPFPVIKQASNKIALNNQPGFLNSIIHNDHHHGDNTNYDIFKPIDIEIPIRETLDLIDPEIRNKKLLKFLNFLNKKDFITDVKPFIDNEKKQDNNNEIHSLNNTIYSEFNRNYSKSPVYYSNNIRNDSTNISIDLKDDLCKSKFNLYKKCKIKKDFFITNTTSEEKIYNNKFIDLNKDHKCYSSLSRSPRKSIKQPNFEKYKFDIKEKESNQSNFLFKIKVDLLQKDKSNNLKRKIKSINHKYSLDSNIIQNANLKETFSNLLKSDKLNSYQYFARNLSPNHLNKSLIKIKITKDINKPKSSLDEKDSFSEIKALNFASKTRY